MFGFLKRQREDTIGYSGSDTHKHIDALINDNGRYLRIITPYIGISYARMLLSISKRKRIELLISGDSNKKDEEAVSLLLKKGRRMDKRLVLILFIAMVASAIIKLYLITIGFGVLLAIAILFGLVLNPGGRDITTKIATDRFVHEKMYISENMAIVGSANLTYSGTHRNVEHIEIIKDKERIEQLNRHFKDIWGKY